jgi:cyanophycinase-like exopeptidase
VADDRGQMLEAMAERAPLPGGVLEQHHRLAPRPRLERLADGVRDQPQSLVFGSGGTGPGMNDHAQQAEGVGTIQFIDERVDRLPAKPFERGREVDQVTGV